MTGTSSTVPPGWHPDPWDETSLRWWDGNSWTGHVSPMPEGAKHVPVMTDQEKGADLEQKIAAVIAAKGYDVQTNVVREGRSGARHEIDVLGVKHDELSSFTVAIECKAWSQPIEKDVVAKFAHVLNDLGLREGIIVTLSGFRRGADVAARELGITLWGPAEIEQHIGSVAAADVATRAPRQEGAGLGANILAEAAAHLIKREARGRFGFGAESVIWSRLIWVPVAVVQVALTRQEGRIKRVNQTRRIWNAYELISLTHVGRWMSRPEHGPVDLGRSSLRPREKVGAPSRAIADAVKKFDSVSTDAAKTRHAGRLRELGIPAGYSIVPETSEQLFIPVHVAIAHRQGAERVIAVNAHNGQVDAGLGDLLTKDINWLRESLGGA